jgi:hypothetical protein
MRNGSAEKSSPESWSYTAVLSLRFLIPESTRNYTCKAINGKQGMEKSVFLLVSGLVDQTKDQQKTSLKCLNP